MLSNSNEESTLVNLLGKDLRIAPIHSVRSSLDFSKLFVVVNRADDLPSILGVRSDIESGPNLEVSIAYESEENKIFKME